MRINKVKCTEVKRKGGEVENVDKTEEQALYKQGNRCD